MDSYFLTIRVRDFPLLNLFCPFSATNISELELESRIFESLFQRRPRKAPYLPCIVNAASDVLDG